MTERDEAHDHEVECAMVLARVQEFLDHELDSATEDAVREHLAACEPCMDQADVWAAVRALVKRACPPPEAPATLVTRINFRVSPLRIERRG